MGNIRINDWLTIPVSERPAVTFLNDDVIEVKTKNYTDFAIRTRNEFGNELEHKRTWETWLQIKPVALDGFREIKDEELVLEVARAQDVFRIECTLQGEWCPAAAIDTGSRLIYVAETEDGPKAFLRNEVVMPM